MDLEYEAILMVIMIAIMLIFIYSELAPVLAPKSSQYYFNEVVSMANSACSSVQGQTNLAFTNPNAFVFQIYDNNYCGSILSSEPGIFYQSTYNPAISNSYDLCFANVSSSTFQMHYSGKNPALRKEYGSSSLPLVSSLNLTSGNQYYLKALTQKEVIYSYLDLSKSGPVGGSGTSVQQNLPAYSSSNKLLLPAISVNSSDSSITLVLYPTSPINPLNYAIHIAQYVNVSSNVNIVFNSNAQCVISLSNMNGTGRYVEYPPCTNRNITNISISVSPVNPVTHTYNFQLNLSATQTTASAYGRSVLVQQCLNMVDSANSGTLVNGSIMCVPITCGGFNYTLTNQNNNVFLGLYGGNYPYFGIQSGPGTLQIVNPNTESFLNTSLP